MAQDRAIFAMVN